MVPSPSWPYRLAPQAQTVPSDRTGQACVVGPGRDTHYVVACRDVGVQRPAAAGSEPVAQLAGELSPQLAATWDTQQGPRRAGPAPRSALTLLSGLARPMASPVPPASRASHRERHMFFTVFPLNSLAGLASHVPGQNDVTAPALPPAAEPAARPS